MGVLRGNELGAEFDIAMHDLPPADALLRPPYRRIVGLCDAVKLNYYSILCDSDHLAAMRGNSNDTPLTDES